jgi:hypothetical protein
MAKNPTRNRGNWHRETRTNMTTSLRKRIKKAAAIKLTEGQIECYLTSRGIQPCRSNTGPLGFAQWRDV